MLGHQIGEAAYGTPGRSVHVPLRVSMYVGRGVVVFWGSSLHSRLSLSCTCNISVVVFKSLEGLVCRV